jgi:hypothetical protein
MAREYTIFGGGQTLAAQVVTLVGFLPSSTYGAEVIRAWVSQQGSTTSAMQRVSMVTQASVYGTAVTMTPAKLKINDQASNFAGVTGTLTAGKCGINFSAEGAGTKTTIWEDVFNVLNGWLWIATPNETIIMPPGCTSAFGLTLPAAPTTTTNWSFGIVYREI